MTRAHSIVAPRTSRAELLPARIEPMLAVLSDLPPDPQNWGFEYKWDGVRCMSFWDGRILRLLSRNHIPITHRYPELANFGKAIGKKGTVLDGEIVALDSAGRPSFPRLQRRMHVDEPSAALVAQVPVWYVLFDILYSNGRSVMDRPYVERRELLEDITIAGPHWHVPAFNIGEGAAMLEAARRNAMEGVVAKLLTSSYDPGRRSPAWRKIKVVFGQEFVIGGWIPEAGDRADRVGALLLGYYEPAGRGKRVLRYAGRVGTGFSDATHAHVVVALKRHAATANPFVDPVPIAHSVFFVKPALVAEVEYRRWPDGGLIHQAAFKGLRADKAAIDVVKEG